MYYDNLFQVRIWTFINPMSKDIRTYAASAIFVIMLILLIGYLSFIPVPSENKDLIVAIIGVLVGKASGAMDYLFGSFDDEKHRLERRIEELTKTLSKLQSSYDEVKGNYDDIVKALVDSHVIPDSEDLLRKRVMR